MIRGCALRTVLRWLAIAAAILAMWWLSCFIYVLSRGMTVSSAGVSLAERSWRLMPRTERVAPAAGNHSWVIEGVWGTPSRGMARPFSGQSVLLDVQVIPQLLPPRNIDPIVLALVLGHGAACALAVMWILQFGWPRHGYRGDVAGRAMRRTFIRAGIWGLGWLALPHLPTVYWYSVWYYPRALGWPVEVWIDAGPFALLAPSLGAILGYLITLFACAPRAVHAASCGDGAGRLPAAKSCQLSRCASCGYAAMPDRPCPECGQHDPLLPRAVYITMWHLRLSQSRWRFAMRSMLWGTVGLLMVWPLVAGLARQCF
jgi:hypothetical protein